MQDIPLLALRLLPEHLVKAHLLPKPLYLWLALGQVCPHGKVRPGQAQCLGIVHYLFPLSSEILFFDNTRPSHNITDDLHISIQTLRVRDFAGVALSNQGILPPET